MKVLLGVCGGIAAYKIPNLIRLLRQEGHEVRVMMTAAAAQFVSPLVLQALSEHEVRHDLWDAQAERAMSHIELARWADAICIAPLTANTAAKLALGLADNLLTTVCLASTAPILLAPAMNTQMYLNPAFQQHLSALQARYRLLTPETGKLACGEVGVGRMPESEALLQAIEALPQPQDLQGKCFVITAGATREALDSVRFISNHSSGKMAFALARAAWARGADVTVIAGHTTAPEPDLMHIQRVNTALEMLAAVEALPCDVFIGAAAVADYRPAQALPYKHKKTVHGDFDFDWRENPDIIASVAQRQPKPLTVGFAAESEALLEYARAKMQRKNIDIMLANPISAMNSDDNALTVLRSGRTEALPPAPKKQLAPIIMNIISEVLYERTT